MASTGQFQLFPPPPPMSNRDSNNPYRKNGAKRLSLAPTTTSTIIEDGSYQSPETMRSADAIEIQVYKEMSPVQEPQQAHVQAVRAMGPAIQTESAGQSSLPRRSVSLSKRPTRIDTGKGRASPLPQVKEHVSPSKKSPVVAIRSMFPRYNPGVPLTKQSYYPQQSHRTRSSQTQNLPERSISRNDYSPSVASVSRIDEIVGGPKTAPASVLNFPTDALEVEPLHISTVQELGVLWEAANGQGPEVANESFNLHFSRYVSMTLYFSLNHHRTNAKVVSTLDWRKPDLCLVPLLHIRSTHSRHSQQTNL